MAGNDIKQRIVLEGEQEYNKALKDAQRNLKVLRSELKAETAELGKNATEAQKNEAKVKNLTKQISEQEEIVKTYEKALEEVRQKYGDNEDAVAKWEIKLNNARTALANMRSELTQTGGGLQSVGEGAQKSTVETYALAESLENIASVSESMSDTMESVFGSVVDTIRKSITAVWGELMEIAGKADNYTDLGAFLGADPTEVQKWDRAMKSAGGSLSTVTSMISRLKYGGKADKVTEWFGISGENYTNDLEYAEQVFRKMAQDKEKMVAAGTWDDAMGDIFGAKKVQEIDGVLSDWEDIERGLQTFDVENGGIGLTGEELQTMNELYSQVNLLQEKWNAFKESVATKIFGQLALDLTSNAQGALDALIELMDAETAEEKEAAIEKFKQNITEAFKKIGEALQSAGEALDQVGSDLQGSENGYVRLLGDILSGLSDAMQWLAEEGNLEKVLHFFEGLFDLWLGSKALTVVSRIGSLVTSFSNLGGMNWGTGMLNSLGGTGAAGGGLGSLLAGAGYLAVGLMMVAPTVKKLFDPNTWKKSETEEKIDEVTESSGMGTVKDANKKAGVSNQDILKAGFNRAFYTGGDASGNAIKPVEEQEASKPYNGPVSEDGIAIPNPKGRRLRVTDQQRQAAEDFWDIWRSDDWGENDEKFDTAYAAMEKAFSGNETTFSQLDDMMQRMFDSINNEGGDFDAFEDLPSNWWETIGKDENDLTREDISGFMELPNKMSASVAGAVGGISVNLDGYKVGQLVAPYVSEAVARDII